MCLLAGARLSLAQGNQQNKIVVTASAGYGDTGAYLIGEWTPVRVTLTNPASGSSIRVRVQVESYGADSNAVAGLYGRDLDLPASSHKEVTLYAYAGNFARTFRVQALDGSATLETITVNADPLEPPANVIVGVASSDSSLLNVLQGEPVGHIVNSLLQSGGSIQYLAGGQGNPYAPPSSSPTANGAATIAHIKLDDIPDLSYGLDSLGAIILDDVDTGQLRDEQRAALQAWVARGGTLVATVRPGGADTVAGLANLLPVTVSGTRNTSNLNSLADLVATPLTGSGPFSIGDAKLKNEPGVAARVLAQQDGAPLAAVRDYGLGQVVYLGVSPGVAPLKNWDGTLPLIKRLLAGHSLHLSYGASIRFGPSRGYYSSSLYDSYGGMFALPGLDLPDPWLLAAFLFVYIIIVGPVNFIILRRMRRAELAWITIPVLVALFSVIAYLLAFQSKGGDLVAIRANVVSAYPDVEQANIVQHFGLFSPIRRTYTLSLPADSAVTEMNNYGYSSPGSGNQLAPVLGGNPTTINNVNIGTWSLRGFVAERTAPLQSPLEAKLHLEDNIIVGTVKNRATEPLQDVALVRGNAVRYVGYMAPGQQTDVRLDVSSSLFDNSSPSNLLPPPQGVNLSQSGYGYPYNGYNGGRNNSAAQRTYNRKLELLSAALYPLITGAPPTDMSVIALAWGPGLSANFDVEGHTANSEEQNVWTSAMPITEDRQGQARLKAGSVPYTVYAPGNSPAWLPWNGSGLLPNLNGSPNAVPTSPGLVPTPQGGSQIMLTPTPMPIIGGSATPQLAGITLSPYADVQYRLPAGAKPQSLKWNYAIASLATNSDIDLLAYNVQTGAWDRLGTWQANSAGQPADTRGDILLPNPIQYTGPAGYVTLRLLSKGKDATLTDAKFDLELNEEK